jgi:mxaJ protein
VWGPIAGYFAAKKGAPLEVVLLEDGPGGPRFAFEISMGVKKGNKELKDRLEQALVRKHDEIDHILQEFGVPLVPLLPAAEDKPKAKDGGAR